MNILTIKDIDVDLSFDEIKNLLSQSTNDFVKLVGFDISKDPNLLNTYNSTKNFIKILKPLFEYYFNSNGFEHKYSPDRKFTNDLSNFFEEAETILKQIQKDWDSIWYYRVLAYLTNNTEIQNLLNSITSFIDLLDYIIPNKTHILSILGHDTTRRLVVFNQNTGEARPTGGFTGSYIPIEIFKGKIIIQQSQSIYHISGSQNQPRISHPANWYYPYDSNSTYSGIQNTNYFPCFDDSASYLEDEFSRSMNGYNLDTLIMITPQLINSILPKNFVLNIDDKLVVNSDNLIEVIERITSLEATNINNPKESLSAIFTKIFENLPEIIKLSGASKFLNTILESIYNRNIQVWFKINSENILFNDLFLGAHNPCQSQHAIIPLISNISGDKRNLVTENKFNVYAQNQSNSYLVHVVYNQIIPENPNLQRSYNSLTPFTFVGLQVPRGSYNFNIISDQAANLPSKKVYYEQEIEKITGRKVEYPNKINSVLNSIRHLDENQGYNKGFTYLQPNNTSVIGVYIEDQQTTRVEFTFEIAKNNNRLIFYGQSGLNEVSLSLGNNVWFQSTKKIKFTNAQAKIQGGVNLVIL